MASERASRPVFFGGPVFFGIAALLFIASATATVVWGASMSAMGGMPMPGGWTLSMAWLPICGQTWGGTAASFLGMWGMMTVAMMLPPLMPMLVRYRRAVGWTVGSGRLGLLTGLAGLGYFAVWMALGMAVFPLGAALAMAALELPALARALSVASGAVVLIAGLSQFSAWKKHQLACCRMEPSCGHNGLPADAGTALRHGLRLGVRCVLCCAGPTAALLVVGVMDLMAMAIVAVTIGLERLAPHGDRYAQATGAAAVGAGILLILRAVGAA